MNRLRRGIEEFFLPEWLRLRRWQQDCGSGEKEEDCGGRGRGRRRGGGSAAAAKEAAAAETSRVSLVCAGWALRLTA